MGLGFFFIKPGLDPDPLRGFFFFFLNPYPTLFLIGSGKIRPIRVGPGRVPSGQAKIAIHDSWAELDLQAKHDAHTVYVV